MYFIPYKQRGLIMSVISLRLPDALLYEVDNRARLLHLHRAEYIRKALEHMNEETFNDMRKKQLAQASLLVRKQSMQVNQEFSDVENDPEV
jgi:metal-responsive CopG/Arc/MetJ family transcriptional regulator